MMHMAAGVTHLVTSLMGQAVGGRKVPVTICFGASLDAIWSGCGCQWLSIINSAAVHGRRAIVPSLHEA